MSCGRGAGGLCARRAQRSSVACPLLLALSIAKKIVWPWFEVDTWVCVTVLTSWYSAVTHALCRVACLGRSDFFVLKKTIFIHEERGAGETPWRSTRRFQMRT